MRLQYEDLPRQIPINVPRGRRCIINNGIAQEFLTDDLPNTLIATLAGGETKHGILRESVFAKYLVESIFGLKVVGYSDIYGNECYDIENINRLCQIILEPWMYKVRSIMLSDEYDMENKRNEEYWIYTPKEKNSLNFSKEGKVYTSSVISAGGYYYEICKSQDESNVISKVVNSCNLPIRKPKAVRPVIFIKAKAVVREENRILAMA